MHTPMNKFIISVAITSILFSFFPSKLFAAELNCYIMLTEATTDNDILPWGTKKVQSNGAVSTIFQYPVEKGTVSQSNDDYCSLSKIQPRSGVSTEYIDDKETVRITYFLGIEDAKTQEGIKVDDERNISGSIAFDHCLITYDYMMNQETLKYIDLTGVSYKVQMDKLVSAIASNTRFKNFCAIANSANFPVPSKQSSRTSLLDNLTPAKALAGAAGLGGLAAGLFYLLKSRMRIPSVRRK